MAIMHAQSVTIEWDDGSKDVWRDVTVEDHQTGHGDNPLAPAATAVKYKTVRLMENKIIAHEPGPS